MKLTLLPNSISFTLTAVHTRMSDCGCYCKRETKFDIMNISCHSFVVLWKILQNHIEFPPFDLQLFYDWFAFSKPPVPIESWSPTVLNAFEHGKICIQPVKLEFGNIQPQDEDCLFLNIYVPGKRSTFSLFYRVNNEISLIKLNDSSFFSWHKFRWKTPSFGLHTWWCI